MPNAEKARLVEEVKGLLKDVQAVWVVDYRGLSVQQAEDLRRKVKAVGATYKIYKNTFTTRALRELELPEMEDVLSGPSGFVFVNDDPVAAAKVLKQFAKENKTLAVKGGLFEGKALNDKEVISIADMPSREELIGQVIGMLSNPVHEVMAALDGGAVFYGLLDAIEEKAA